MTTILPISAPASLLNLTIFETYTSPPGLFFVRIFGHRGTRQFRQLNPNQNTASISEALIQPYEWAQILTVNGPSPVSTARVASDQATLVVIEVPDGRTIRYEYNSPQRAGGSVAAGMQSNSLNGVNIFRWESGTTISVADATVYP